MQQSKRPITRTNVCPSKDSGVAAAGVTDLWRCVVDAEGCDWFDCVIAASRPGNEPSMFAFSSRFGENVPCLFSNWPMRNGGCVATKQGARTRTRTSHVETNQIRQRKDPERQTAGNEDVSALRSLSEDMRCDKDVDEF